MEIRRFINALKRKIWLFCLLGLIGGSISFFAAYNSSAPVYEATTTVLTLSKSSAPVITYDNIMVGRQFEQDYRDILLSGKVISKAQASLESQGIKADNLAGMINLNTETNSSILKITAASEDPQDAVSISREVSKAFIETVNEITKLNIVGILDEPKAPAVPLQNSNAKQVLIGIFTGLVIAFVITYITELFDNIVRSAQDVEYNLKLPVLAQIPRYTSNTSK